MTKEDIAREVSDLLEWTIQPRNDKAYQVVGIILNTIKMALHRGESVRIVGLGTFAIRTRPAVKRNQAVFVKGKVVDSKVVLYPPKRYVYFKPVPSLKVLDA